MKNFDSSLFSDDAAPLSASQIGGSTAGLVHTPITIADNFTGTSGNDTFTGTAGDDTFDLSQGGNDTASGLAGDDTFLMGSTLTFADRIDGGDGFDTVQLNGSYTNLTLGAKTLVNIENLQLLGGNYHITTNDGTVAAGATMNIDGSQINVDHSLNFNGSAELDGNFTVIGGAGNDTITTGAGSDFIDASLGGVDTISMGGAAGDPNQVGDDVYFGAAFTAADSVNGGDPSLSSVELQGDYSAGVVFGAATMTNVGFLDIESGKGLNMSFDYSLTTNDANVAAGQTLTVFAKGLTATEFLHFDGSAETDGSFAITGGAGNDVLTGGAGDDFFKGDAGDDIIDGGAGKNRATFSDDSTGVTVTLLTPGHAQNTGDGMDTLTNIQDVSGGSGNDTLTGDNHANWLWGEGGSDTISGGGGNDIIQVGQLATGIIGTDVVDGGSANNTLSFDDNGTGSAGVTFSLALQGSQQATGTDNITATNFQNVTGSSGGDTLTGDGNTNILYGGAGDDVLSGGAGNDTLYGDKVLVPADSPLGGDGPTDVQDADPGTGGDDILMGGVGNDTLDGGEGSNTASYADGTSAVKVNLTISGFQAVGGGLNSDSLINIQNLIGSDFNDTLTGNDADNTLTGGAGNDTFFTGGGNDTVVGGDGNDTVFYNAIGTLNFQGGAGTDTLDAHLVSFDTVFFLGDDVERFVGGSGADTVSPTTAGSTTAFTMSGNAGNDNLTGGSANDHLDGGDGDDTLNISQGGNDTVTGDAGNDTIVSSFVPSAAPGVNGLTASDRIDGGDGTDTLSITGDYSAGIAFGSVSLTSVENIVLGVGFSYKLTMADANVAAGQSMTINGTALDSTDVLTFNAAHETNGSYVVDAGQANDVLTGGAGNDTFFGNGGADKMNGGTGSDTFVYDAVTDSTGYSTHDVITAFNGATDTFDMPGAVGGVDAAVTHGELRSGTHFDVDLAAAIGSAQLAAGHAVVFTADSGNLSGRTYLIVDANGTAGYQAGQDYVIELTAPTNLDHLSAGSFI